MQDSFWYRTLTADEQAECALSDELLAKPDVAVLGGGLVGLAAAYFAAQAGLSVHVIASSDLRQDKPELGLGGVWPYQSRQMTEQQRELASQGRDLWAKLGVRPEFRFDWRVNGRLDVTFPDTASAQKAADEALEQGITVTAVDAGQIAAMEPALRPGLSGLHYPSEAHLHPLRAWLSLARAARLSGVRIYAPPKIQVTDFAGLIQRVACARHRLFDIPRPELEVPGMPPRRDLSRLVIASNPQPPLMTSAVHHDASVLQLRSGEVLVTSCAGSAISAPPIRAALIDAARALVPKLSHVEFPNAWRQPLFWTLDESPIVEGTHSAEGDEWFATCHGEQGPTFAPLIGKLLAQSFVEGRPADELTAFSPARFV